jgi:hypothetical protein
MTDFVFQTLVGLLRGWLFQSAKLAEYAKWALRIRDYMLLFFPLEMYPVGGTDDPALKAANDGLIEVAPVPIKEVEKAAKKKGFNIPFIKGM